MAMYDYVCSECDSKHEMSRKISDRDVVSNEVCVSCGAVGTYQRGVSAPLFGRSTFVNGAGKPPSGFREVLKKIHTNMPGSQMDKASSHL